MYQIDISPDKPLQTTTPGTLANLREWQSLRVSQNLRIDDGVLKTALSLFFLYQYPQFMFIYREAFLEDYHENLHDGKYWSYPLLYAMCALGVRTSPDPTIKEKGDLLSHCAETIVMSQALGRPHITVAQTLLCLAFYEFGSGNHSKGWSLAGTSSIYSPCKFLTLIRYGVSHGSRFRPPPGFKISGISRCNYRQ